MYIHNKEIEHQSYLIGSHNSWSYKKALKWYMRPFQFIARCQEVDVEKQFIEYGIRVFDLRVSFNKKGNVIICHGLMKYDADVFEELNKLNNLSIGNIAYEQYESRPKDKVWCRVLLETSYPSKEEKEIAFVEPEKCVVVMSKGGLIKRIPTASFRTQKRNGKGVKTQDDINSAVIRTNTIDSLMVFTDQGKMYRILVDNIPVGTNVSKGTSLHQLIEMQDNENPSIIYSIYRDTDAKFVLFVTKNGLVKKTSLEEYIKTKKKTGIAAISLKEGDSLASVSLVKDEDIVLLTAGGMGIRFNTSEVAATSRATSGVKGITLKENDYVVAAMPVRHSEDQIAVFAKGGLGKKFPMNELPVQKRAGKGLICYKPTENTGNVTAGALLSDEDSILLIGDKSSICIAATEVPVLSRVSIGNQLIKNGTIYSVSKV